jgi:hypothetical protein
MKLQEVQPVCRQAGFAARPKKTAETAAKHSLQEYSP